MDIKKIVDTLPDSCGVYIMKAKGGKILYIGKATSIKKRVLSHARSSSAKAIILKNKVVDIEYMLCDTEEQALILEASLIKERKPQYNVSLRDDKSYPYVVITKDTCPRIYIRRLPKVNDGMRFGPFTNVRLLKRALHLIRKIFPYCSCKKPRKGCLYQHLKVCPELQAGGGFLVDEYKENIDNICKVLSGSRKELVEKLGARMQKFVLRQQFEEAAKLRDQLVALYTLYSGKRQVNELLILKEVLNLKKIPFIIEAIDISSLFGKEAVGSVVVFRDGLPDKSSYRRYRIKQVEGIDDYRMIQEVVKRRYGRATREGWVLPQLIIIDGGYAHVRGAAEELNNLKLDIFIIGIAKKNEEIWFPRKRKPLVLSKDNSALHLLQRIRDEAHRFAHAYHLLRRKKRIME